MTCETCAHRVETTCHRYPPQLMQGHVRIWPTIAPTDHCGEWNAMVRSMKFSELTFKGAPLVPDTTMIDGVEFVDNRPKSPWWRFWR